MTVRQGRREALFTLCPFIPSVLNDKSKFVYFSPLGHISFSLSCLYEETDRRQFPPQPLLLLQHHGFLSLLKRPKTLTPVVTAHHQ